MIRAVIAHRALAPEVVAQIRASIDAEHVCIVARPRVTDILDRVCAETGLPRGTVVGPSQRADAIWARFAVSLIAHRHCRRTMPEIGAVLGGRDRSTIRHQLIRAGTLLITDTAFECLVVKVCRAIAPGGVA